MTAAASDVEKIREELRRILSSSQFKASNRRRQFLEFVVDRTLKGEAESIKAYTIAVQVFGRNKEFNQQTDPIVSVEAGRLRRALEHYYLTDGAANDIRIEIPKGSFVPHFQSAPAVKAYGTPAVVPPGEKSDSRQPASGIERPAVVVAAFQDLGSEGENQFYADGISGHIVANLYRYREFAVIGPLTREQIKDLELDMSGGGISYHVQLILSGTVQVRGDLVRITARLVDASSGENVWVKQYQHDLSVDAFHAMEDAIAERIVATVADKIGVITRLLVKRTAHKSCQDLTAYEATLKMYHWGIVLTEEAFYEAWRALEHAVVSSPASAESRAMLADVYASDYLSEIGLVDNRLERAEELARESLNLDPDCPDGRWVMGFICFLKRDADQFVKEFEYALELNPMNPFILANYGLFLPGIGIWDQALTLIDKARTLNPHLSGQYYIPSTLAYYRSGRFEEALKESLGIETPGLFWEPLFKAAVCGQLGRVEQAKPHLERLLEFQPSFFENGMELIRRLLFSDENVTMIAEGLRKAGAGI